MFESLAHTADLALRAYGKTLPELFENVARGMFAQMTDISNLRPTLKRRISLEATDLENLLVDWLNELLYYRDAEKEAFTDFHIHVLTPTYLEATVEGTTTTEFHRPVKAATYHQLEIRQTPEGYVATVVFDV